MSSALGSRQERLTLQPAQVVLRHIRLNAAVEALYLIVGGSVGALPREGLNGRLGYESGGYELRVLEEGSFSLRMPNAAGADGVPHRDRFLLFSEGRRTWLPGVTLYDVEGGHYRPGDEWIEIYEASQGVAGDLLFVGTPTQGSITKAEVRISGGDGAWTLKKQRETAAGFWRNAPRDVIEHYTRAWRPAYSDAFLDPAGHTSAAVYTYSSSPQSDLYGHFTYTRSANSGANAGRPGTVRLFPNGIANEAKMRATYGWALQTLGLGAPDPHRPWKLDFGIDTSLLSTGTYLGVGLARMDTGAPVIEVQLFTDRAVLVVAGRAARTLKPPGPLTATSISIEGRGRYLYVYANSALIGIGVQPAGSLSVTPFMRVTTAGAVDPPLTLGAPPAELPPGAGGPLGVVVTRTLSDQAVRHGDVVRAKLGIDTAYADISFVLFRVAEPYLMRGSSKGDYTLPGAPPPGGLLGAYFNDSDLKADQDRAHLALNPTRSPYAQRVDGQVSFDSAAAAPGWQPLGGGPEDFSARWIGSVYLPLATADYRLRVSAASLDSASVYVGRTRIGEEHAGGRATVGTQTPGAGLRAVFGNVSGWYPLLIEWQHSTGPGKTVLEWSIAGGAWTTVPATSLSPYGIYEAAVRYESHFDMARTVAETFAYQWTCEPKQLESGEFPGRLVPRLRVGRDTEKVIDELEAQDIGSELDAEGVADIFVADAAGVADSDGSGQLTAEAINFDTLAPGLHVLLTAEYDSLAEIGFRPLLEQRLNSILVLHGSTWEQVAARPAGHRELLDAFPLAGELAELAWLPGDGVRIVLPEIGVVDRSPRQILGISRAFRPDGLQGPIAAFRQRPRSLGTMLREMLQTQLRAQRNYQGTIVTLTGTLGGNAGTAGTDSYSRVTLPSDLTKIVSATLVVVFKSDRSPWQVEVNGVGTERLFAAPGRFDITPLVARRTDGIEPPPAFFARGVPGTGTAVYALEVEVVR